MRENVRTLLLATVILLTFAITADAQPTLITEVPRGSTNFVKAGSLVYFTSGDSLLRTDGTDAGTIFLMSGLSTPFKETTGFDDMLFFVSGNELWRSDGTPGGTIQLISKEDIDILAGTGVTLFFQGSDAASGQELYRTNGTSAGTLLVKDINPGAGDGFMGNSAIVGDELMFRGNNGVDGDEPWKSNGTAIGTVMIEDINAGSGNGFVYGSPYDHGDVYSHNGQFYFTGNTPTNGKEPWVSDGTAAGTSLLRDVVPGTDNPVWILYAIDNEGDVYFITKPEANMDGLATSTLWKTGGTAATTTSLGLLIEDYSGWPNGVTYNNPFRIYHGKVYFFGHHPEGPHELWVSDGTVSGTHQVSRLTDYYSPEKFHFFDVVGEYLLFYGSSDGSPTSLYRSDGTTGGTGPWYRFAASQQFSIPLELTKVNDMLFYPDHDGPTSEGGTPEDPDDYFHLFQNDGETWISMRTMFGVSTIGTDNITDYNGIVAFTTQNDQSGSTDSKKYLWIYNPDDLSNALAGKIEQEVWNHVPGTKVSSIPVNDPPSSVNELTVFETPSNVGDNYGSRVRGFVLPAITGDYAFWIASDDQGELWLSSDMDPSNKVKIAEVTGWTNARQWDKYPSQRSASIRLEAGNKYYIEALWKEGSGRDHLAVGWQLPNNHMQRPIPGARLMVYEPNTSPKIVITSPEDGDSFTAPADITITANASDDGTITKVEFYNSTDKLGEDTSSPYSFTWNDAAEGSYEIIAKAIANDGGTHADTVGVTVTAGTACAGKGMIQQEFWMNVPGTKVSAIPLSTEPDLIRDLADFTGPPLDMTADNYGSRIRGYICPPTSGEYTFWVSGDDNVELWLSTDSNPLNKKKIAYHTGWTNKNEWTKYPTQKSVAITLSANQKYYIEALMKEASGGDHISVGWRRPGAQLTTLRGAYLIPFERPTNEPACAGKGMIQQEFWMNVPGTKVSAIPLSTEPDLIRDLADFTGPPLDMTADNYGSRIRGYICPPTYGQYTFWVSGDDNVELWLSTDSNPLNKKKIAYHTGWTNKNEWTKYPTQKSVAITLAANQKYYIEALMKEASGGDHISVGWRRPDAQLTTLRGAYLIPFERPTNEPACAGTGTISFETWTGIDGTTVSSIPINTPPNLTGERTLFEAPTNAGSNFGSRFRGYVCVPVTGNYTFWIASDDHSELWLSTDADPANKVRIANVWGWTNPRQWTKYATQQSAPISLVAGQQYYIEALYKEDEGGDNMAVGWQLPDGTMERPIPGNRLSPFAESSAAMASQSVSSQEKLYEQISVYPNPARSDDPALTISGYEGIEQEIETDVSIMNMTGEVVFSDRILCGGNCGSYLMNLNKQLVPGVYVVSMKTNGVRTSKRLLVK